MVLKQVVGHLQPLQYGTKNLFKKFTRKSKRKVWYESPALGPTQFSPSSGTSLMQLSKTKKPKQESTMRTSILSTILYKAISDFINSHEISAEVHDLNIEISKVSLPSDFSNCRVYWKTSGTSERDQLIQQVLERSAPRLRHLLISHQVLGSVPPLVFIRDKQYAALVEIENLLKMVDLGREDAEPLQSSNSVKDRWESVQESNISGLPDDASRVPLSGIDHEAMNKKGMKSKQRQQEALSQNPVPSITPKQLDMLANLRRQKLKKKKSKWPVDNDITPQAYLQTRYNKEPDTEEDQEYVSEELRVQKVKPRDES
ncbi:hypothetical protein GJAV_G00016990 [Gymnothorax javanicus]|nr:hypothetical protein GJAV_G00016990 [Gymnothorax javanicus]